jgi:hypothetical protein
VTDLLMTTASMVNEEFLLPPHRDGSSKKSEVRGSSSKKREASVDRDREASHVRMHKNYFDLINPVFKEKAFDRHV